MPYTTIKRAEFVNRFISGHCTIKCIDMSTVEPFVSKITEAIIELEVIRAGLGTTQIEDSIAMEKMEKLVRMLGQTEDFDPTVIFDIYQYLPISRLTRLDAMRFARAQPFNL